VPIPRRRRRFNPALARKREKLTLRLPRSVDGGSWLERKLVSYRRLSAWLSFLMTSTSTESTRRWLKFLCDACFDLCPVKEKCGEIQRNIGCREITAPVCRLALAPIMDTARPQYSGLSRKLIVALDIGTTFSGAAYALLDPGRVPQIRSVTRQALLLTLIR